jgi:hypothetical protein
MAKPPNNKAARVRRALERRYPGVVVEVHFRNCAAEQLTPTYRTPAYKGWHLSFAARDPNLLVSYGLASGLSDFDRHDQDGRRRDDRSITEFAGYSWYAHDDSGRHEIGFHIEEEYEPVRDRALTKKMQTQVLRLLKPFIRDAWKPSAAEH